MANRKRTLLPNLNKLRRQADKVERAAHKQHQTFISGKVQMAREIRFDVGAWLGLIGLLLLALICQGILYRQSNETTASSSGGAYAEGIIGEITSFNPLYAETNDEKALSSLVYSALLKTDQTNSLTGDLAERWTVSSDGLNYNVKIRTGALWHGSEQPVTADDVLFTVQLMRDPLTQSSLYETWKNIEIAKIADDEVRFTLRTSLVSFPWALNFGILSKEELKNVNRDELREYLSDHIAAGSGPFVFRNISLSGSKNKILYFAPNPKYFDGAPQIEALHIETYSDSQALIKGFKGGEINLASGISLESARENVGSNLYSTPVDGGIFAIFNTESAITSSPTVRQALRAALDRDQIRQSVAVGDQAPNALETPIAAGIFSQVDTLRQPVDNISEAERLLNADGWQYNNQLRRVKDLSPLKIKIVTVENSDYATAAAEIARQWNSVGVESEIVLASAQDIQQNFIMQRNFDVLVYRLELGGDGDVYSYWHSTGAREQGLNLANYKSAAADVFLARARTQIDTTTRGNTYKDFVETWINDVPAIALYQANLYYLKTDPVHAWQGKSLTDKSMRFRDVNNFTVNTIDVNKTP
ncbi:MAG: ABC transporter substrate-binding protein [Candidatus Nomurabacteria bacterium]|jgi:peptide/nickel transport system substrate-binding protein|nr:ABC transporter substrate-binding protein [Candidatus Nomurabacteria bacterium]